MSLELVVANLLSPPILFFILGAAAAALRSDLAIPEQISKLFALYLLWAIGFKGGVALRASDPSIDLFLPLVAAIALALSLPLAVFPILRRFFTTPDACAIAACYGSVSVVTFITATNFLGMQDITYGGQMIAALALMEAPPIVVSLVLFHMLTRQQPHHASLGGVVREAIMSGPVFLLIGSLLAGLITSPEAFEPYRAFTFDIFHGVLVLFLLDAGLIAGARLRDLQSIGGRAVASALSITLASACVGIALSYLLRLDVGDALLMAVLAASASYIAVPAAMRIALPEANPGIYLPMSLAITFPFNICLGIPLYLVVIQALWPEAAQ